MVVNEVINDIRLGVVGTATSKDVELKTLERYFAYLKGGASNCGCHDKQRRIVSRFLAPAQESGYGLDEDCNFVEGGQYTLKALGGGLFEKVPYPQEIEEPIVLGIE